MNTDSDDLEKQAIEKAKELINKKNNAEQSIKNEIKSLKENLKHSQLLLQKLELSVSEKIDEGPKLPYRFYLAVIAVLLTNHHWIGYGLLKEIWSPTEMDFEMLKHKIDNDNFLNEEDWAENENNKITWHTNLAKALSHLIDMNYVQVNFLQESVSTFHISLTNSGARTIIDYYKNIDRPLIFKDDDSNIFIKVTRESMSFINSDSGEKLKSIEDDAINFYKQVKDLLDNARYEIPKNEARLNILKGKKWNKMIKN